MHEKSSRSGKLHLLGVNRFGVGGKEGKKKKALCIGIKETGKSNGGANKKIDWILKQNSKVGDGGLLKHKKVRKVRDSLYSQGDQKRECGWKKKGDVRV